MVDVRVPPVVKTNEPPTLVNAVGLFSVSAPQSAAEVGPVQLVLSIVPLVGVNVPPAKVPVKVSISVIVAVSPKRDTPVTCVWLMV